ncbi:MAG: TIGR00730 family Rossman fold protein [Halobacteriaceae archaeon]
MDRVCVYCGSNPGRRAAYREAAGALGRTLADRGLGLVYGGGSVGLMGELAAAALDAGGDVVGVIPESLADREVAYEAVDLRVVDSMHERKRTMVELADAFVALPGGLGTAEELFEVLTWAQLGIHTDPVGLLEVEGYFEALLAWLDHATAEGFVREAHRELLVTAGEPATLLDALAGTEPPAVEKWLDREDA